MLSGPDTAQDAIVEPVKAPPPPPMPVVKKKDAQNSAGNAEVETLKGQVAKLNQRIGCGDTSAESEYDQLKQVHSEKLSAFNKLVNACEVKVKDLEEDYNTQTTLLAQATNFIQSKQTNLNKQLETLALQKAKYSQLALEIDAQTTAIQAELKVIAQREQTELPRLKATQSKAEQELKTVKAEFADLRKQREQLAAMSQAVPARVKTKQAPVLSADIDFQTWIDNQLLGGLYLSYLKKFINKDQDQEVIARYQALTTRKNLPPLSLPVILGIAAGVIRRADEKAYLDAAPLRDTLIDNSRVWLLQALFDEFYQANPAFKLVHAAEFSTDPNDMPTFIKAVLDALNKAVVGAQPRETPRAVPVAVEPTKLQLPAVTLRKAVDAPALNAPPKAQLPAFELKKTQAPTVAKRALPPAPVQPVLRRVAPVVLAADCKNEVELPTDGRPVLTASH